MDFEKLDRHIINEREKNIKNIDNKHFYKCVKNILKKNVIVKKQ